MPYAVFANMAGNLTNGLAAGTYTKALTFKNAADSFNGTFFGAGSGLTNLDAGNISSGTLADARPSAKVARLTGQNMFSNGAYAGGLTMMSGGNYSVTDGFWSIISVVQTVGSPPGNLFFRLQHP